jgi:N-methylhydantoinase A
MLFPDIEHHYVRTHKRRLDDLDLPALESTFGALVEAGSSALQDEGFHRDHHRFERLLDLRYAGANSELTLPFPSAAHPESIAALREAFGSAHVRHYGYRSDDEVIEIVNARVIARASRQGQLPDRFSMAGVPVDGGVRSVYFGPRFGLVPTPVISRDELTQWRAGPLLVEEFDSTTVVPPDGRARLIAWDTIEIALD